MGFTAAVRSCLAGKGNCLRPWVIEAGCGLSSFKADVGINGSDKTVDHIEQRSASDLFESLLFGMALAEY